ncbi:hypothetical protein [Chishuiella sp.]|uniref:hypothetical protein n=1 Tax=Chishuiella sp. TaxID=1969467 RepID=UPI0028A823E1|nr:hypothetical protein [Chishuiella sp.]
MRKIKYLLPIVLLQTILFGQGGVGINTETPERSLDVNGNLRITSFQDKTEDDNFKNIIIANSTGNIDKQSESSMFQTPEQQVETERIIYYSSIGGDSNKEAKCGKFSFIIDENNIAKFKLLANPEKNTEIQYGLRRLERRIKLIGGHSANTGDGEYYYTNFKKTFTTDNWDVYQNIFNYESVYNNNTPDYTTNNRGPAHMINNDFLKLHLIDPESGDFYKIHITRMINQESDNNVTTQINLKDSGLRVITCERYYKQ